jgi:hypothetical protein
MKVKATDYGLKKLVVVENLGDWDRLRISGHV